VNILVGYYICINVGAFGPVKIDQNTPRYTRLYTYVIAQCLLQLCI